MPNLYKMGNIYLSNAFIISSICTKVYMGIPIKVYERSCINCCAHIIMTWHTIQGLGVMASYIRLYVRLPQYHSLKV